MAQYTPERAASYEFASLPSGVEYMVMYVRNDDNEVYYNDYQSFNGLRIGVLKGNFQTEILSDVAVKIHLPISLYFLIPAKLWSKRCKINRSMP